MVLFFSHTPLCISTIRASRQAEGGEQGDPLVPALFALAMHQALVALQTELRPEERSLAFLNDALDSAA